METEIERCTRLEGNNQNEKNNPSNQGILSS